MANEEIDNKKPSDDRRWTTLSSEYLIRRPWMTARRDKVQLPDGRVNPEFYVLEYPAWVNVIAITDDGYYLMERQYRHGLGIISTEIPAGVAEEGEDPLEAAKRELLEETGYSGGRWSLQCVISGNPSTTNNLTYCFLAEGVTKTGSQHLDATEDLQVFKMTREQLLDAMMHDPSMKQALMLAPLWRHFYLLEKENCHK